MAFQGASSSSLSPSLHWWTYDVFLNFRGEDTRKGFTAYLHEALDRKKINTYIDYKLPRGEEISEKLLKAIESSRISIVVLSKNYASSTWCLDELIKILECKNTKHQKVLPVFYNVSPTEVRHQRASFGEALAKLKDRLKDEMKVQRWKEALKEVATLSGFNLEDRCEPEIIQEIVREVLRSINVKYLNVVEHLVGMQSRVQDVRNKLLSVEVNDTTRILGIFGIGGVGKTTLAKVIYNSFIDQFEYSCFLANLRETSQREYGLIRLQNTLLREILRDSSLKVRNDYEGVGLIKKMLWSKKVLLVLDDVDQLFQVENLLGEYNHWFGSGSLIIITTRDKRLLTYYDVHLQYKMKELDHNEALRLFCLNAFRKEEPNLAFAKLTKKILRYAGGLPLALEVLGSYFHKRDDIKFWEDSLEKYKRIPPDKIQDKLRIGYDGLEESEKNIFLDIACFFAGARKEYVTNILNGCGLFPHTGIPILREKSLITIDEYGIVNMHDLLKVMGKEIVRKESIKNPGKRSRLWFHEDVRSVLEENKGTNKIEGILIDLPKEDLIHLSPGAFEKMPNLRILINRNAFFSELPNYFSNKLRVLDFKNYHGTTFPSNFNGEKLVALRMEYCLIYKELGNKFKNFQNLKFLNFKECEFLTRIPDTSGLPNLEQLDIFSCKRLVEVDQSIGSRSKLVKLLIRCCPLNSFPSSLNSRSLKELIVEWCPSLVSFPKIGLEMKCLTLIKWSFTGIKELPSSIENLTELQELDLEGNNNLAHIPSSILQLEHLSRLDLDGCTEIITYPKLTDYLSLHSLPPSKLDSSMFTNCFSTLTELDLSRRTFVILPGWMNRFVRLRKLDLEYCKRLIKIEELPPNIEEVDASGCISLESFPEVSKRFEFNTSKLSELHSINLTGCSKMLVNVGSHVTATLRAQEATGYGNSTGLLFPGNKIPNWFYHCKETSNTSSRDTLIEIELLNLSVIKGILTCAVFETSTAHCAHICIAVNYDGRCLGTIERSIRLMGPDDVLLDFHDLDPFTLAKGSLQLHFHCDLYGKGLLQRCGVHLVRKDEEA